MDINSLLSLNLIILVPKRFTLLNLTMPTPKRLTILDLAVPISKRFTLLETSTLIFLVSILLTSFVI